MAPSTHSISDLVKRHLRRDTVIKAGEFHLRERGEPAEGLVRADGSQKTPRSLTGPPAHNIWLCLPIGAPLEQGKMGSFADQENQRAPEHRFCNFPATHKNGITHQASFSFAPN